MNLKQLKEIIRLFQQSSLTMLDVQEGEERVRLQREPFQACVPQAPAAQAAFGAQAAASQAMPLPGSADDGPDFNRIIEVKSPVVGVYYVAPEPGGKPFVQVGDRVMKGDVLCLIEVMKQVTEVVAPRDGQVADICLHNGSVVEYDQTLIKLC